MHAQVPDRIGRIGIFHFKDVYQVIFGGIRKHFNSMKEQFCLQLNPTGDYTILSQYEVFKNKRYIHVAEACS